jgi:hypothetical protein
MKTDKLPQLGMDGVLCDRPQEGCVVGKFINRSNPRKEKTMNKTLSADQLSRYVGMRIRNPAAADRYWATCMGRNIAADAAMDDETAGKLKEFLKTKLSHGDHAQVCDMLEAAGGEPDAEAEDDLPENAVERPPEAKKGVAGLTTDSASFNARYPGLSHIRLDNSGTQPRARGGSYSDAAAKSFADRYPGLQGIKQA